MALGFSSRKGGHRGRDIRRKHRFPLLRLGGRRGTRSRPIVGQCFPQVPVSTSDASPRSTCTAAEEPGVGAESILSEFTLVVIGCTALGVWTLTWGSSVGMILAVWLLGLGANYLALTRHAIALRRPAALDAELADVDLHAELRTYTRAQVWVLVPFWIAWLGIARKRQPA